MTVHVDITEAELEKLLDFLWRAKTGQSTKLIIYCPWVIRKGLIYFFMGGWGWPYHG